jgi:hypothetical protein
MVMRFRCARNAPNAHLVLPPVLPRGSCCSWQPRLALDRSARSIEPSIQRREQTLAAPAPWRRSTPPAAPAGRVAVGAVVRRPRRPRRSPLARCRSRKTPRRRPCLACRPSRDLSGDDQPDGSSNPHRLEQREIVLARAVECPGASEANVESCGLVAVEARNVQLVRLGAEISSSSASPIAVLIG